MVQVITITKAEMLNKYARKSLVQVVPVNNVEGKNWLYAITIEGQVNPNLYVVVRCEN